MLKPIYQYAMLNNAGQVVLLEHTNDALEEVDWTVIEDYQIKLWSPPLPVPEGDTLVFHDNGEHAPTTWLENL